jgi:hypothetical protein
MTKVFLDTEFTNPCQSAELISLALVAEDGAELYAEFDDYNPENVSAWVWENVFPHLNGEKRINRGQLRDRICAFLRPYESVELWADCCAFDWVLFCELFGGPGGLPQNIFGNPFDIQTCFVLRGVSPRINRQEFSGVWGPRHHALWDARVGKACFEKLAQASR